jgi:hypothetical protein
MKSTVDEIEQTAAKSAFGRPLVANIYRSLIVEAIVSKALSSQWTWCSADWAPYDFRHVDGTRLEVKQTAAKQSWNSSMPSRAQWDIAPRTGFYDGPIWTKRPGRNADIYVLAMHSLYEGEIDHRDPSQWDFFILPTAALPDIKTLSLGWLKSENRESVTFMNLGQEIEQLRPTADA